MTLRLFAAAATIALTIASSVTAGPLKLTVTGVNSDAGQVICRIFDRADSFPTGDVLATVTAPISGGEALCDFGDVAIGDYAIAAAHDANANDKMDKNFLGLPREGFGFSRDAKLGFGPPSFDEAVFTVDQRGAKLRLTMKYL